MAMYRRWLVAAIIGIVSCLLCSRYQISFGRGAGDISWPLCGAQAILAGSDAYLCPHLLSNGQPGPSNPLTTALAVLPFSFLPPAWAAGCFFGLSSAFLSLGLTRDRQWWRLLAFLAFPYWAALQTVQWSPLFFAVALYPTWLPLTLAKPQLGLPIALTRLTWRRAAACAVFGLSTLLIAPTWPLRWLEQIGTYDGFIPLLTPLGLLLLLALRHWRQKHVQLFLLLALTPQRLFYDQLLVWLLPRSMVEMLGLAVLSWLGYFGSYMSNRAPDLWVVATLFLPALVMVMRHSTLAKPEEASNTLNAL